MFSERRPSWWRPETCVCRLNGIPRSRVAAGVIIQFVAGHKGSDELRELVQNEFDAGGSKITVRFNENALEIIGVG